MSAPTKFAGNACCRKGDTLPALYYFDASGRAEAARFCFLLGGVEFKDIRFSFDSSWQTYWKKRSPTGQAPWLEVDGMKLPESRAILMYAARKGNLIPASQEHTLHCEMLLDMIYNLMNEGSAYAAKRDVAVRYAAYAEFATEVVAHGRLLPVEKIVLKYQAADGYLVGGSLSYADIFVATYIEAIESLIPKASVPEFRMNHPALNKVRELIYNMEVIKDYLFKYPSSVVLQPSPESCERKMVAMALEAASIRYTVAPITAEFSQVAPTLILNGAQRVEGLEAIVQWINNRYSLLPLDTKRMTVAWEVVHCIRDICAKYQAWETSYVESVAALVDAVDSRLRDLNTTEGGAVPLTIADFAAALLYEWLSLDNKCMKFATSLETLADSYNRVYLIKSVRLGYLKRNTPCLYYFDIVAKAESCRWMFHVAGIPFNDERFNFEEWTSTYKAQSPSGQAPYLKIGNEVFVESLAITKMIGDVTGYAPHSARGKMIADCVAAAYQRCMSVSDRAYLQPKDDQAAYRKEHLPPAMDIWEKVLAQSKDKGDWIVENRLTWIDIYVAAEYKMWHVYYKSIDADAQRWPTLTAIYQKVLALPAVQAYEASLEVKKTA